MAVPPVVGTYTVKPGDSLWAIAARTLGRGDRWQELYDLNRPVIGKSPSAVRPGMVLRLPGGRASVPAAAALPKLPGDTLELSRPGGPAAAPAPIRPAPVAKPADARADGDRDGVPDLYDRAPGDAADKRWNLRAARDYGKFAKERAQQLAREGAEIDCADLAVKLLEDFARAKGLPNPFAGRGSWSVYTPERTGGLPNVKGPNYFRSGMNADNLGKEFTRRVNDADGNALAGFADGIGYVDTGDLRPGDILFYDWDEDGEINHTVNVLDIAEDGTVTIAFGTYDNTAGEGKELTWDRLDLAPVEVLELRPGTAESLKYLGPLNRLWGARRFNWLPDEPQKT